MPSRRLITIRHAKAAPGADDRRRALTLRGQRDAAAVGEWLAAGGLSPDRVVVSPSTRTRQTWELAAEALSTAALGAPAAAEVDDRIYDNTTDELLAVAADTPADAAIVILVGHSPGVHELAVLLDAGSPLDASAEQQRRRMVQEYPTAGVAVFGLTCDWADVGPGCAALESFAVARG